ncbi:ATP-binding cassette domain-containing protein [Labilibaculum sp. DW002]|uniref:ATP-binding cassette domain-containing protein n=1 Tax=Paralabilibaculum antarcticum TaxID=2912572 RepID=A0ABT5VPH7_9BACT|nr:ATP-binding cassette domain-containing protein [Labilibaculum sp. DW002]MDE5417339.1 ATP-binding cassette domain-containing protein [Labilibaculum sp. DW002]
MITVQDIQQKTIAELFEQYPFLPGFFEENTLQVNGQIDEKLIDYLKFLDDEEEAENRAIDKDQLMASMTTYITQMLEFLGEDEDDGVHSITLLPGTNKSGEVEKFEELKINKSEIVCIVGPTGSGKSRLLADIEWVAQKDTPTSRSVLVNGEVGDSKWRLNSGNKLVAQLSQNMNFVMDLTVYEFIELHAQSRLVEDVEGVINKIFAQANDLAGEKFELTTPITSLSGGQSRALMIADTAILSKSPIILIDEIENAGIDRKRALDLLVGEEKIVLMATHDPILALMGDKRIVIKNGGIHKVIETSDEEQNLLSDLERMDAVVQNMRTRLRQGEIIQKEDIGF